jgi:subtilisin family serine protease
VEPGIDYFDSNRGPANHPCAGDSAIDKKGWHGTAVAAVIAGQDFGVAPDTKIIPVRTFDCGGNFYLDLSLAGLDWIAEDYDSKAPGPAVVNISWFGPPQSYYPYLASSIEIMVNDLIERGITVITSANNLPEQDACYKEPANLGRTGDGAWGVDLYGSWYFVAPRVITVGGTMWGDPWNMSGDHRWQDWTGGHPWEKNLTTDHGSSWGPCVATWAPAADIRIASHKESTIVPYLTKSGTSFAAPQIAGVAARFLETQYSHSTRLQMPDLIWDFISQQAQTYPAPVQGIIPPSGLVGGEHRFQWNSWCRSRLVIR